MVAGIAHAMLGSGGLYSDGKKSSQAQNHANACWMGGLVVASLWQAVAAVISSPTAPSESWHVRLLLVLIVGCAFALCAQLLLYRGAVFHSTEGVHNGDPKLWWHEDEGVSRLVPLLPPIPLRLRGAPLPSLTLEEVRRHNTLDDCWVVIDARAYDITRFVRDHPGGVAPLLNLAGRDVTDVFANYHAARIYSQLPQFLVGRVSDVVTPPHVADFRAARQELLRRGLFETDYRFYAIMATWLGLLFFSSLYCTFGSVASPDTFTSRMAGAALMGLFWQQLAGVGHDLGHTGVTHIFHRDHLIGSGLGALMGLSTCWWKSDHNTHHVACNAVEHDPNIQHMPMLAITEKIFRQPFYDTYHGKWVAMDALARALVSRQHFFFYPLMAVARFNLYAQGLIHLLVAKRDTMHHRAVELASLAVFAAWFGTLLYAQPSRGDAWAWLLLSHAVAGVLHVQICLSHWSLESYLGSAYNSDEDEWHVGGLSSYQLQLRTTMNVETRPLLDWVHIGLQFQIEHHLYPRLPRHNLRIARALVKPLCVKHGIPYHEVSFFEANVRMWRALRDTARAARAATRGEGGTYFYRSALWDGLNLGG